YNQAYNKLLDHFKTQSLAGFGCEELEAAVMAAGQVLTFVEKTQKRALEHVNQLQTYNLREYMMLDSTTRRNLELTRTLRDQKLKGSLLSMLDQTVTSMGGRLIKRWLNQPLINKPQIEDRLAAVSELTENYILLQDIRDDLEGIYDLERILGKITYESANARDLAFLRISLKKLPGLAEDCSQLDNQLFQLLMEEFDKLEDLYQILNQALVDDPPVSVREGGLIKEGYHQQLDQLRQNRKEGKDWIASLQQQEREKTGISSLKVGFNKIFGYYIEVTNPNLDQVPEDYTRKQTLSNSERYIIPELKEKEAQVLGAEEKINDLEYELFVELRSQIGDNLDRIKQTATVISRIDVLTSLAQVALEKDYVRPEIEESQQLDISRGRHPVVEYMLPGEFVPNDCYLDHEDDRFIIITGPNMSGKSTYMRQVALIGLMAQIGSFVPAAEASIGIVDRIFTRVGASDDLTTGQSTFMIEMNEVANIVNNATEDSLIILDEVGRGTSTYDGVSIAWAVSEYINDTDKIGARSLFATHYHELTQLEGELEGIKNYNVLVEEDEEGVNFLYKIAPGRADESYGIEVARLAGLPDDLTERAGQILAHLEGDNQLVQKDLLDGQDTVLHKEENDGIYVEKDGHSPGQSGNNKDKDRVEQLPLFQQEDPIVQEIRDKDLMGMTPLDALNYLYQLQQQIKGKGEDYG
ncbi:MAG: DNA mismatch repair protein MutS, partial [Bacillota bacterium]